MSENWQQQREPLRVTLARTLALAVGLGLVIALLTHDLRGWPALTLLMLWPTLGGYWVEAYFLNELRPRLPRSGRAQRLARIAIWFAGGVLLVFGMRLTASILPGQPLLPWLTWLMGGAGFVALELAAHALLQLRGRPNFYDASE